MEAALAGRVLSGAPDVIVLMKGDLTKSAGVKALPVYDVLLYGHAGLPRSGRPRLIAVKDTTLRTVAAGLVPYRYKTAALLPSDLTVVLDVLAVSLSAVGVFGPIFGWAAHLFVWLQLTARFDSGAALAARDLLIPTFLLGGYWIGFVGRLVPASRFEAPPRGAHDPWHLTTKHAVAWLGLLGLLSLWFPEVTAFAIGWSAVLAALGWFASKRMMDHACLNPALRRPYV